MKKPEITPGEWSVGRFDTTVVSSSDKGLTIKGAFQLGAKEYYNGFLIGESIQPENAKAISAVPDMIEALIEARAIIITDHKYYKQKYGIESIRYQPVLEKINQALLKAGASDVKG